MPKSVKEFLFISISLRPKVADQAHSYLGNQNTVTDGHAHGDALAIAVQATGSDGENLGLVELLNARLGQEDAAGGLGLGLDALDKHAVQEGSQVADGSDGRLWFGCRTLANCLFSFAIMPQ